jgi:hypothetical protein
MQKIKNTHIKLLKNVFNKTVKRERRDAYRALVGKLEGSRPLERPSRRWEDNIKMVLREVGWGAQTRSIWLRIGTGGGLLCIW